MFGTISYLQGQSTNISLHDTVYSQIGPDFYGIQYHTDTFNDPKALNLLQPLKLKPVRVWARLNEFHPQPGVWQWQALDQKIDEVVAAGYEPMVCLYQSEEWFTGSSENPWWNDSAAVSEWQKAAYQLALRFKDRVHRFIIFDEINMMHPKDGYYITFKHSAQLYCQAASEIKRADSTLLCGGPSSFGGWENGHWAEYVLNEPQGADLLDFISCNLFLSWNAEDPDSLLMNRTIWYEEAPQKIKSMIGDRTSAPLVLDAYNVSALWQKDGQLWTDPRNTNFFGGIYQVAALMHAAKGGFSITLHWETLGGYGIFDWYPQFNPLPPYFAWRFLIETAGLKEGSRIIGCQTSETPLPFNGHHGGMTVNLYTVQPFAVQINDSTVSIVLINKYRDASKIVTLTLPDSFHYYRLYRFDEPNMETCFTLLKKGPVQNSLDVSCPQRSVMVVQFYIGRPVGIERKNLRPVQNLHLEKTYPNPFNSAVRIAFTLKYSGKVTIDLFNAVGRDILVLQKGFLSAGRHQTFWNGKDRFGKSVASGIYFLRVKQGRNIAIRKLVYLK